jgi:hypothetical protein
MILSLFKNIQEDYGLRKKREKRKERSIAQVSKSSKRREGKNRAKEVISPYTIYTHTCTS